ncbi:CoA-acylating methylmalonate-semialdehyde dehydrogenase [Paeniglutamicibacter cryotolerans]|uniref:methylmalonate-semialdehyde dehydrogenase (CoA acylating) n=1 Tax=Paeniglutamicibacter cryotolerans TaxID=670079 RepID=A0A839QK16_9MICC|nr:CoA-acylating methylmalonate-semialdehyde dehydrogenase [Paeniglutamicibacter cryotolerans]MBB2995094.1 malonate-semialdehyde dehydrogenase (acetylating)/methylmalonate-semialdehyde dehydrogenase [Paeniglutamicibacter cryotolerans]
MSRELTHYVGGKHVKGTSGRFGDVYNPSTGEIQSTVPLAGATEVEAAIATAQAAHPDWAATNPQRRARILHRFVDLVNKNMDELAALLTSEHGKTFADSKGDFARGLEVVEYCAGAPQLLKGEFSDGVGAGIDVHSMRQSLGVVAGITPFNFPAMIPLWKAGPALAAGNTYILKPSERDPSVPLRLAELFTEAGLPDGVFNVVNGDKEAVDALTADPRIQAIGFVGSTPIAKSLYAAAAAEGKRAQCFGGAKNHLVIMPDADMDMVADALIGSGYGSAGERCMAISVAIPVGEATADALVAKLKERIAGLRVGDGMDPDSDFGPVVAASAKARIEDYIQLGTDEGAELVIDGRGLSIPGHENGFWIGPTLFDHVTETMRIYREEIFGPVLCVVRAQDYEEALRLPSEHQYGNGVSIFTRDGDTARDFSSRVQVGMVGVNIPIPVPVSYYSFGGWKASGFGDLNQHGADAFRFYTKTKTVTTRWPSGIREGASFTMPEGS